MNFLKTGSLFLSFLLLTPVCVYAQTSSDDLNNYTPPQMFGGSVQSQPVSPPLVSSPIPAAVPVLSSVPVPAVKPAPDKSISPAVIPRPPAPVTKPPEDKEEKILKTEPLPIQPIVKHQSFKPVTPPEREKEPAYVPPAPKVKTPDVVPAHMAVPESPPAPVNPVPGLKAEDLLNHAVTTDDSSSALSPSPLPNPLAVPASKVDQGLPLPGSVPAKAKTLSKTTPKTPSKTALPKPTRVIAPKKTPEKKPEVKKTEVRTSEKKPAARDKTKPVVKVEEKAQPLISSQDKAMVENAEQDSKTNASEKNIYMDSKNESEKKFHLNGKKNMPTAVPGKVEKATLDKPPLPALDPSIVAKPLNPNEKIIDQSLEKHIVEPDMKKIEVSPAASSVQTVPAAPKPAPAKAAQVSLEFKPAVSDLQADQKKTLDSEILPKLKMDPASRLQILAYASASKDGQSSARRMSLSRGLALRNYLLDQGVEPTRIDIRALGDNTEEKPLDRTDLLIEKAK